VLKFQSQALGGRRWARPTLNLDIVDYPGEWLLDLPLLSLSFAEWSAGRRWQRAAGHIPARRLNRS
jgi:uncharacterized protein